MPAMDRSGFSQVVAGVLVVDKPLGWNSMRVVARARRAAGGIKTGHAGTLDPLATGVVVVCLGKATKCVDRIMGMTKIYEAEIDLTAFTSTDDREGQREEIAVEQPPTEEALRSAMARLTGQVTQRPPAFSAVHINGQRAWRLARRGEAVEMPERTVRVDLFELLGYAWPVAHVRVTCGKGTYIRSLARDLGVALGTGGHLASLRRLAVGAYDLSKAVDGARLDQPLGQEDLLPMPAQPMPALQVSEQPVSEQGDSASV
jgi:tRNA pseudouridine55 synthase